MPRQLRIEYPGAIYHVMSRGDRRERIFADNTDRESFLKTLGDVCAKTGWQIHAYCLMENHFHLVIETPQPNLVAGMKWFLGTYTMRFNRRHKMSGHLFSGRYKSLVVDGSGNGYLRTVCDYVHLNPIRAKLTSRNRLADYVWSSYSQYLSEPMSRVNWLRVDRLLGEMHISQDSAAGRREFQKLMDLRCHEGDPEEWNRIRRGWCLGEDSFRRELLAQASVRSGENHLGAERRENAEQLSERIIAEEFTHLGWTEQNLPARAKGDLDKIKIAQRLRRETTVSLKWIAARLQMGTWTYLSSLLSKSATGHLTNSVPAQVAAPVQMEEEKPVVLWD